MGLPRTGRVWLVVACSAVVALAFTTTLLILDAHSWATWLVAGLSARCPECSVSCPTTPQSDALRTDAAHYNSTGPPFRVPCSLTPGTKCCIECDIAELKIVNPHQLLNCPHLNFGANAAFLENLGKKYKGKPVWVAVLGDSILRNAFTEFPVTMMGKHWLWSVRAYNKTWYHEDQVFCCKNGWDTSTCMYGRRSYEFDERVDHFVQKFVESSWNGFCYSFTFTGTTASIQPLLEDYMGHPLSPTMVIFNPGVHHSASSHSPDFYGHEILNLFQNITEWQRKRLQAHPTAARTRFIYHTPTVVNTTAVQNKKINDDVIVAYNEIVGNLTSQMRGNLSDAGISILDAYRLTSLGDTEPSPDGLHHFGNYGEIVDRIHVNFLLHDEFSGFCSSRFL